MRPLRLEMKGFATFRENTEIDFTDIELVALIGPTGSGKSSIIDAMTFALYGSVARYDERAVAPVINQLSAEARVRFDFEVGDVKYSATRVVLRTKTGGATTKEARFERDGTLIAGDSKELTEQVTSLLGLDFERFNKTVVLPQGKFADFLHDKPASRQELLRELLGLGVYQRLATRARERASQLENSAAVLEQSLAQSGDVSDARLAELEAEAKAAAKARSEVAKLAKTLQETDASVLLVEREMGELELNLSLLADVEEPEDVQELVAEVAAATVAERAASGRRDAARVRLKADAAAQKAGPAINDCSRLLESYRRQHELDESLAVATERVSLAKSASAIAQKAVKAVETAIQKTRAAYDTARLKRDTAEAAVKGAGDPAALQVLLTNIKQLAELTSNLDQLKTAVDESAENASQRTLALSKASEALRILERHAPAAALAAELHVGDSCPVCDQVVHKLPAVHSASAPKLASARKTEETARRAAADAEKSHFQAVANFEAAVEHQRKLTSELKRKPDRAAVEVSLRQIRDLEELAAQARAQVETAEREISSVDKSPSTLEMLGMARRRPQLSCLRRSNSRAS